ncbi:unnamed protein product [Amoebophrya sp. A120]|nr:unnamed protein product [Amoebophrya sp. A120]|eukprot:GSA120T00013007001.1
MMVTPSKKSATLLPACFSKSIGVALVLSVLSALARPHTTTTDHNFADHDGNKRGYEIDQGRQEHARPTSPPSRRLRRHADVVDVNANGVEQFVAAEPGVLDERSFAPGEEITTPSSSQRRHSHRNKGATRVKRKNRPTAYDQAEYIGDSTSSSRGHDFYEDAEYAPQAVRRSEVFFTEEPQKDAEAQDEGFEESFEDQADRTTTTRRTSRYEDEDDTSPRPAALHDEQGLAFHQTLQQALQEHEEGGENFYPAEQEPAVFPHRDRNSRRPPTSTAQKGAFQAQQLHEETTSDQVQQHRSTSSFTSFLEHWHLLSADNATDSSATSSTSTTSTTTKRPTYCILYSDETFLCPNDEERVTVEKHIQRRQDFYCYSLVVFLLIAFGLQGFVDESHKTAADYGGVQAMLQAASMKQFTVVLGGTVVVALLIAVDLVNQLGGAFFGEMPPERLDLEKYSIGDVREGVIFSEATLIVMQVQLMFMVTMPFYLLFVALLGTQMGNTITKWKSWEFSGFSEKVLMCALENEEKIKDDDEEGQNKKRQEYEKKIPHDMCAYLATRRSYISPHQIYENRKYIPRILRHPDTQFLLYMYLRPELVDCAIQVVCWPARGQLILAGLVLGFFLVAHQLGGKALHEMNLGGTDWCLFCPVVAAILKFLAVLLRLLVKEIVENMSLDLEYFKWLKDKTHGKLEAAIEADKDMEVHQRRSSVHVKTEVAFSNLPVELIPKWKYARKRVAKSKGWLTYVWYGTFDPTRQEMLWPRWRNGPSAVRVAMQEIFFFATLNCGLVAALLLTWTKFDTILSQWNMFLYFFLTLGITLHIILYDIAPFITLWTLAARTDTMTDDSNLQKEVREMSAYFGDAALQEFCGALYLHVLYKELHLNSQATLQDLRVQYYAAFSEAERSVIADEYEQACEDPAAGLTETETNKLLKKLGFDNPGADLSKWVKMLQIHAPDRLQEAEFEALVAVFFKTCYEKMPRDVIDTALMHLADAGEIGELATHVSVQKMVTIYESVGISTVDAKRHAKDLLYRAHIFANEGASLETEAVGDLGDLDWSLRGFFRLPGSMPAAASSGKKAVDAAKKKAAAAGETVSLNSLVKGSSKDKNEEDDDGKRPLTEKEIQAAIDADVCATHKPGAVLIHIFAGFLLHEQNRRGE